MNEKCFAKKNTPSKTGNCVCLVGNCPGYQACSFYKPVWKHQQDVARRFERLAAMPIGRQNYISNTYYRGQMPWRKDMP